MIDILMFFLFMLGIILLAKLFVVFNRRKIFEHYEKIKQEWLILAENFQLRTNIGLGDNRKTWVKGFEPNCIGTIENFPIRMRLTKQDFGTPSVMIVEIEVSNPYKITFALAKKEQRYLKTIFFPAKSEFDKYFNFFIAPKTLRNVFFSEEEKGKIINVFSADMRGFLSIVPQENKNIKNQSDILDVDIEERDALLYTESGFKMLDQADRVSFENKIKLMIEIAKIIATLELE